MCRFWADVPERLDWSTQSVSRSDTGCLCVCEPYVRGGQRQQKIAFKEATDDPPDTHSRFWAARAARSSSEFINDLKYRFAPREYMCVRFGCESVAERTY